jgi:hypothetical protein
VVFVTLCFMRETWPGSSADLEAAIDFAEESGVHLSEVAKG